MKNVRQFLCVAAATLSLGSFHSFAQSTYSGNQSTGFGGPLGKSTLTVSDNATTGSISFNLALGAGNTSFNDIAFYFSTGSGGVSDTSGITDTGDEGRRAISGDGVSSGRSLVSFASGFSASYAVAIDSNGNANLFQIVPGQGYLTYVGSANYAHPDSTDYGFSINASQLGLTAGSGESFGFVATLSNANDSNNGGVYRSNETIGASNVDGNSGGNLGNTGTLMYSSFDTYTLGVPEPASWIAGVICLSFLGVRKIKK